MARVGSFLDLKTFSSEKFEKLFLRTEKLRRSAEPALSQGERLALLFFEPSTRTRMSFESAAFRCGLGPLVFDGGPNTSLEKGETVEDSILNVAAMQPRALVIRCGDSVPLQKISDRLNIPILNAGWGIQGHPTQALLDTVTMKQHFSDLRGKKVLILGDVRHSRVAASHFELLPTLGIKVAICGPEEFLVSRPGIEVFRRLSEALDWADVAMCLRVQFERHVDPQRLSSEDYRKHFGLNAKNLRDFATAGIIMHPGPINHGIEMETEVLEDSRSRVMEQVTNGVYLREALLRQIFEGVI